MKSAVTLQDVAKLAGVSAKTVSRVINSDPAVTEKTAERVRKAIDILAYTPNPHARSPLGPGGVPVVAVDRPINDLDVDTVLVDNMQASRQAVAHLIAHGHRRVGFLGNTVARFTVRERLAGYRQALEEAGLPYDESLVALSSYKGHTDITLFDALVNVADPPTALFSSDAVTTMDIVRLLHREGRTDIAFVGFDDFVTADSLIPPVTVVRQDPSLMGRTAAELLLRRINGDHSAPERIVLETTFVERGSGEILAPTVATHRP